MPDSFIPISRAPVAASGDAFKPLQLKSAASLSGLPPLSNKSDPSAALASSPAGASAANAPCSTPKITLQRQGDTVSAIRIQCPCGQVIELSCVY